MDYINKLAGGSSSSGSTQENVQGQQTNHATSQSNENSGGFMGGIGDKLNSVAGGGKESEKNEDYLDKGEKCYKLYLWNKKLTSPGVDFVQEKFLGQGPQDNESAVEQAKDEQISDFVRKQYKGVTGSDVPIKDKKTTFG